MLIMKKGSAGVLAQMSSSRIALAFAGCCLAADALAGNGLLPTGFGVESQGFGGADVAVSRDTSAANTNPAGLAQIENQALDLYLSPFFALRTEHRDGLGNNQRVDNKIGFIGGLGYARRLDQHFVLGLGTFVQGGTGFTYKDLDTGLGNQDELSAQFGVMKAATALSWQPDLRWRLGVGLGLSYGKAKENIFPNTSNSQAPFFGYSLDKLHGMGVNGKIGVQFLASEAVTIGLAYTSRTPLGLEHGILTANYESIGMGRVTYRDASLRGLSFGQQVEFGAAWRPTDRLLISAEVEWIDWSHAMSSIALHASRPSRDDAPQTFAFVSSLDWNDQYPLSIGAMYQLDAQTEVRFGYSHAENPTPGSTQSPVFAVIAENQVALSFRRQLALHWTLDLGTEYQPFHKHRYNNSALPTGTNATETNDYIWLHMMIGRRW